MSVIEDLQGIAGSAHVLTGEAAAPYAKDWTGQYESAPLCVVKPASTEEVSAVMRAASAAKRPVVASAGRTGLTGATHAPEAIVLSLERMNRIREIRPEARVAIVDSGVILAQLREAADAAGLVFPLTFGAQGSARIGGVLSTNAGGSNVLRYGNTRALCLGLEVVLADGRVLDLMSALAKDNSGYDLRDLFIGAEGTLGIITGAVMRLHTRPLAYVSAMIALHDLGDGLALLNRLQAETGGAVEAFEYMPRSYMEAWQAHVPDGRQPFDDIHDHAVFLELGVTARRDATVDENGTLPAQAHLEEILGEMISDGTVLDAVIAQNGQQRREMWARRELAGELMTAYGPVVLGDVSVPLDQVAPFLEDTRAALAEAAPGSREAVVSHLGDGNVHYAVWPSDGLNGHAQAMEIIESTAVRHGGSFSAEHGVGLTKRPAMARHKDPVALEVMRVLKSALDPGNILNPGKVLPGN
ncbi:FAD-binding oxidoreductase [Palleronia caenipelagi]|uniref:FAD-binding oxidoreductase n=1 Tax=Palleronia caenipelagi TaxID=2489174 RepID=A0A547Q8X5_9RHOB|nr:FAD-binding oxidoreductase [Palleronia caenipelagi]TRD22820.1 FAD-binding oxidoreductase [Palleronia caenipelagi]